MSIAKTFLYSSFLCAPVAAQSVGGEVETLLQFDGTSAWVRIGEAVDGIGDVNGDGVRDLLIGTGWAAPGGLFQAGSVWVYSGLDGTLIDQFDGTAAWDTFGSALAGAGDVDGDGVEDLIVGAPYADPGGLPEAGSAYVYSVATGALLHQFDGAASVDELGSTVCGAGDVDGDGFDDLIVGAKHANPGGLTWAGSAYVFSGATGGLLHQWDGLNSFDEFGGAVSAAGDVDSDGYADVIIGAAFTDPGGLGGAGTAFVFSGNSGSLLYRFDGYGAGYAMGHAVAAAGDVDADGVGDLIVGAKDAHTATTAFAGSAYVFSGASGLMLYQFDGEAGFDRHGEAVSGAGDVNGDGFADVIVGAQYTNPGGIVYAGSAYVYSGASGAKMLHFDGDGAGGYLGKSVCGVGDLNGDGLADVMASAYGRDIGAMAYAGSVYVYSLDPFLYCSAATVSAAAGGVLDFTLDFPSAAKKLIYRVLLSASGTGPTTYGVDIPLTMDGLAIDSYNGIYPVTTYTDLHGKLNLAGNADGSLTVPAGLPSGMVGSTFWVAAIASPSASLPAYSSIALSVTITP